MRKIKNTLKLFRSDDIQFLISCGLKFSGIYLLSAIFIYYIVWILISFNNIYFESMGVGFSPELREIFFEHTLSFMYYKLPEVLGFFVLLFFAGMYIGKVLLRPFEIIGRYCLDRVAGKDVIYNPDVFSDYKLMTRFSEFFFVYTDRRLLKKTLKASTIPDNFSKIRTPPFERVFFFHFTVIVFILAGFTGVFIAYFSSELRSSIVDLSLEMLSSKGSTVGYFMEKQSFLFDSLMVSSSLIILVGYGALCFHLYSKVAGAIFGFFATMRAFMKGNFKARVHLIGYAHIRPHGRAFNKFLDHIERECLIDDNMLKSEIKIK